MSGKHAVVQGATLKCKFSEMPQTDTLKVKSQSKHFANDKDVEKKTDCNYEGTRTDFRKKHLWQL